jgi:hypothetical protein
MQPAGNLPARLLPHGAHAPDVAGRSSTHEPLVFMEFASGVVLESSCPGSRARLAGVSTETARIGFPSRRAQSCPPCHACDLAGEQMQDSIALVCVSVQRRGVLCTRFLSRDDSYVGRDAVGSKAPRRTVTHSLFAYFSAPVIVGPLTHLDPFKSQALARRTGACRTWVNSSQIRQRCIAGKHYLGCLRARQENSRLGSCRDVARRRR